MEAFSALLAICAGNSPVPGEFSAQRPVTRSFDVFFDLRLNKRLSKQSRDWWFEMPAWSLWRHRNDYTECELWRHNGRDGVSNHQPHDYLLIRIFRRRSKKTSKLRVTGLCAVNSPVTGEFTAQRASNAENVSIWWRHHRTWHSIMPISSTNKWPLTVKSIGFLPQNPYSDVIKRYRVLDCAST